MTREQAFRQAFANISEPAARGRAQLREIYRELKVAMAEAARRHDLRVLDYLGTKLWEARG